MFLVNQAKPSSSCLPMHLPVIFGIFVVNVRSDVLLHAFIGTHIQTDGAVIKPPLATARAA